MRRKPLGLPTEQSGPIQLGSQLQRPVSGRYVPCPLHWSGHWTLASSQFRPPQPGLQRHSPLTQTPWLEQVGSKQSTEKSKEEKYSSLLGAGPRDINLQLNWPVVHQFLFTCKQMERTRSYLCGPLKNTCKELKTSYQTTKSQTWRECKRKGEISQAELGRIRHRGVSFNLENPVLINISTLIKPYQSSETGIWILMMSLWVLPTQLPLTIRQKSRETHSHFTNTWLRKVTKD